MREETILQLRNVSTPRQFLKDEYICYEGQPGNEMYIILKGEVGVFITSALGTLMQVAKIGVGDFFGEMAIFDDLPRSASCIASEDTIVVEVTKDNLQEFLATCPEIAKQMLENMSGRIRKLDAELYQNNRFVKNRHVTKFSVPSEYKGGHKVKAAFADAKYIAEYKQACPICGRAITVKGVRRNLLAERGFDTDCRISYVGCEPLWYEVISCPHCHYSNHYLKFFGINNFEFEVVEKLLQKEHRPVVEFKLEKSSEFDQLVIHYLQAININEHINPGADVLIGNMWRNLYWLAKDVSDTEFAKYCALRVVKRYKQALEENQFTDVLSKCATALSLVSFLVYTEDTKDVLKYIHIATESPDHRIRKRAEQILAKLKQKMNQ